MWKQLEPRYVQGVAEHIAQCLTLTRPSEKSRSQGTHRRQEPDKPSNVNPVKNLRTWSLLKVTEKVGSRPRTRTEIACLPILAFHTLTLGVVTWPTSQSQNGTEPVCSVT